PAAGSPARARCPGARRGAPVAGRWDRVQAWRRLPPSGPALAQARFAPLVLHLDHLFFHGAEGVDQARVEVLAALRLEVFVSLLALPGGLVRARRGERVVHVGDGDDARAERDMVADQA